MTSDLDDPLLGRTLGGRFRVDRALKRGGMGAVYRGHDLQDDVDVAIKVVKQTLADDPEAIARFKRETRLMAEVQDPHIVRAVDAGDEAGVLWIAMELLDGPSLRERLDSRGRWPWSDTLPIVRQIALALGAAHDKGVTHRDLKPENIMLVDDDAGGTRVKLLDFGVARQSRAPDAAATHMTGTGLLVGTPGYIAPEVVLEGTVDDPRSDFYALGVTWFEMLTGQKPFSAKTPMALALRHAHEVPPTPSSLLPFAPVPGPVEQLVMRLLEKTPEARPPDATALVLAVDHLKNAAEQANTPISTIKDLSPSESTVTSMETPGTHVTPLTGRLAEATTRESSSSPSSVASPAVAAVSGPPAPLPSPTPSMRQWLAAGLVLVVVVAGGAVWSAGGRERRVRRPDSHIGQTAPSSPMPPVIARAHAPPQAASGPLAFGPAAAAPVPPAAPAAAAPVPPAAPASPTPLKPPRRPAALVDRGQLPTPPPVLPLRSTERGSISVQPLPKDYGWRVSINGQPPRETPFVYSDAAGAYTLVFSSPRTSEKIQRRVTIRAGQIDHFGERLIQP